MNTFSYLLLPALVVWGVLLNQILKHPERGVYLYLFLASVTMSPELPLVRDKLAVADFVMFPLILILAMRGQLFRSTSKYYRASDFAACCLVAWIILSNIIMVPGSGNTSGGVLITVIFLYGYLSFRVILRVLDSKRKVKMALLSYAAGGVVVTIVGFLAASGIYKPAWTFDPVIHRISSTLKTSGQVSSYLAPCYFIFVYIAGYRGFKKSVNWLALIALGMALMVLLATGSRIAFAITCMLLLLTLFLFFSTSGKLFNRLPGIALSVALLFGGAYQAVGIWQNTTHSLKKYGNTNTPPLERAIRYFAQSSQSVETKNSGALKSVGGTRYNEISVALRALPRYCLFGVGSGQFSSKFRLNEVHNSYVSVLIENGLPALILLLVFYGSIAKKLHAAYFQQGGAHTRLLITLICGALLSLALYQMTTMGMRQRPFWFIPALGLCVARMSSTSVKKKIVSRLDARK